MNTAISRSTQESLDNIKQIEHRLRQQDIEIGILRRTLKAVLEVEYHGEKLKPIIEEFELDITALYRGDF